MKVTTDDLSQTVRYIIFPFLIVRWIHLACGHEGLLRAITGFEKNQHRGDLPDYVPALVRLGNLILRMNEIFHGGTGADLPLPRVDFMDGLGTTVSPFKLIFSSNSRPPANMITSVLNATTILPLQVTSIKIELALL